ncbi:SRPBCC family protein [Terrabacter sp. NPDC000476]|uniref:SRPBCC family protein n=1 Tax=Terrabacter sp. NPDC000476 TaxID=3154258 RepID=UPI00331668E9
MEYTTELVVHVPRARFIELFDDPANLPRWQPKLRSVEPVHGTPGHPGAQTRLTYERGRGTLEMVETVTRRDLPYAFEATYDAKGVHNVSRHEFHEDGPDATRWVAHDEFVLSGFMKVVGLLFGRTFPKETRRTMEAFQAFAEAS